MESRILSIAKTVSWYFLITVGPAAVIYLATREIKIALIVGIIDVVMQTVVFIAGKYSKKNDIKN